MSQNNLDKTFIIKSKEIPAECNIIKSDYIFNCENKPIFEFNDGINFKEKIKNYIGEDIIGKILIGTENGFELIDYVDDTNYYIISGQIDYDNNTITLLRNDNEEIIIEGLRNDFINNIELNNTELIFTNTNEEIISLELNSIIFSGNYNDLSNLPNLITNHSQLNLDDGTNPHGTTKNDVGLSNVPNLDTTNAVNNEHTHGNKSILDNITEAFTTTLKNAYDNAVNCIRNNGNKILTHIDLTSGNPHNVTKNDVGLSEVDNTSDLDKPISNDTQNALDLKANDSDISTVGKSNDYEDLDNKPTLDFVESVSGNLVDNTDDKNPTVDFNTSDYDLKDFENNSTDKFIRESDTNLFDFLVEFVDENEITFRAPYDMQINSVVLSDPALVPIIEVNGVFYTFEDPIDRFDKIKVTSNLLDEVVKLKCERI
jgi:hypothetical protein